MGMSATKSPMATTSRMRAKTSFGSPTCCCCGSGVGRRASSRAASPPTGSVEPLPTEGCGCRQGGKGVTVTSTVAFPPTSSTCSDVSMRREVAAATAGGEAAAVPCSSKAPGTWAGVGGEAAGGATLPCCSEGAATATASARSQTKGSKRAARRSAGQDPMLKVRGGGLGGHSLCVARMLPLAMTTAIFSAVRQGLSTIQHQRAGRVLSLPRRACCACTDRSDDVAPLRYQEAQEGGHRGRRERAGEG